MTRYRAESMQGSVGGISKECPEEISKANPRENSERILEEPLMQRRESVVKQSWKKTRNKCW